MPVDDLLSSPNARPNLLLPQWPAPRAVRAAVTLRNGGASAGPWESFNLADHVGDDPHCVATNRNRLASGLGLVGSPQWLMQEHGVRVVAATADGSVCRADGSYTRQVGVACAVLTADCLPVLLCDQSGTVVAAAHAGWRGLATGILATTVAAMGVRPASLLAWLGPAIGAAHFEVGAEVRAAFESTAKDESDRAAIGACFIPSTIRPQHYHADLYQLARHALARLGVFAVYGGDYCTFRDSELFYSHRRDGVTGRMASLVWLDPGRSPTSTD